MNVKELENLVVMFEYDYDGDNGNLCHEDGLTFCVVKGRLKVGHMPSGNAFVVDVSIDAYGGDDVCAASFRDVFDFSDHLLKFLNNGDHEVDILIFEKTFSDDSIEYQL